jgi:SAM-dependent methyltransferase
MRAMSFGTIADEYNRLRPDPADSAVEWLLPSRRDQIVDLAAGTGKLTRALARRAGRVVAIEPDCRMGAVLRSQPPATPATPASPATPAFPASPATSASSASPATSMAVVAGLGEAIPLRAESADGLFISSAWHWMNPALAVPEIARVLRDGGRFGLIWTSRDREVDWVRELDRLREPERTTERENLGSVRRRNRYVALPHPSPFTGIETAAFTYSKTMTADDVVEMVGTYSRVIVASGEERAATLAKVRAALDARFPGARELEVPIRSQCWRATRLAR